MFMKKAGPLVVGAAVAFATVIAVAPAASADVVTADKDVTFTCTGSAVGETLATLTPNTFKVTYPDVVAPGELFTVSVQPGQMRNGATENGRMTFDYALPTTGTILETKLSGGASGLTGTAPSVIRVNANSKNSDASGTVARIWGGSNSGKYGQGSSVSNNTGGIHVPANTNFQLPTLDIVMRAPAQVGANVTVGLPGATVAGFTAPSTDFQWVKARNNSAECSSGPEAAALTTTTVGELPPVLLPSNTTITGGDRTLGINEPTEFTAKVSTEYVAPAGTVEFWDVAGNVKLAEANLNAQGEGKVDYTFAPVPVGEADQIITVEARYPGVTGDIATSSSGTITVTNTNAPTAYQEIRFDLKAQLGVETPEEVPVTINATIIKPAGTTNPTKAMVQLYRDDVKVGEPQALPAGNQMTWTDTIERQQRTATVKYRVEFVAPVIYDFTEWKSATPQPVGVVVNGTNPSLDPPLTGGEDSGSLNIFGSLGNAFGS